MTRRMILALALVLPGTALADTVVLKNGRHIEGRVLQETDREVTIETHGGVLMRFERRAIASIEKEAQTPAVVKPGVSEDLGVPDGASDDEVERLRALVPQLRDTARRYVETKKEREKAEAEGSKDLTYLKDREAEFKKQLDALKAAREAIQTSASDRLLRSQRQAKNEAAQLREDTEKLKAAFDAPGLAERAQKLLARVPENPREPRHAPLLGEALYAMEASGDVDERASRDATTSEARIAGLLRAGEHFAWCIENDPDGGDRYMKRAVSVYSEAHRAARFDTRAIEQALQNLQAYMACADLVEDRLGERRWGPELAENEAGQYRLELKERVVYGNEPPAARDARSARERRDRTESRKDGSGTRLVKVTRWYELVYDPQKKRWTRDSAATDLESKKLIPLLREAQEKADLLAKAKAEQKAALRAAEERRDGLDQIRHKVETAEATEDQLDDANRKAAEQAKLVSAAQDGVAQAQAALGVKQAELVELEKEIDRARRGE